MTLDEAIGQYTAYVDAEKMGITSFTINTREAEQIAEWLKELKAYREELSKEIKNAKIRQVDALEANVKTENYNSHLAEYIKGYICGLSYTEGIIAKILEEVNADEDYD